MAVISDEDVDYVKDNPFSSLGLESLRAALKPRDEDSAFRDAISNLLHMLQVHPVAKRLKSTTQRPLNGQLAELYARLQYDDVALSLSLFDPLTTAVADYISDLDIWKAALQLINSQARITPPSFRNVPASYSGTPFTRTSASHQGSDQTRADLKGPLRIELSEWTYENVGGFWEKYFGAKGWTERCTGIFQDLSKRHDGNALREYPDKHSEDEIWKWLDRFQDEVLACWKFSGSPEDIDPDTSPGKHLDPSRGRYFRTTKTGEITGGQHERQLDLFVKRCSVPTNKPHNWGDILVVGELTCSSKKDSWSEKFLQLAVYVREVFAKQPLRRFVHGFLLFGTEMQLWVFDRSGAYSSDLFDIREKPERFICAIAGYVLMSDEELGLDAFVQRDSWQATIAMANATSEGDMVLMLEPSPFIFQRSIVSRGTACHRTMDGESVVKFSWRSAERRAESDLLKSARGSAGVARLVCARDLTSIKELRSGLDFSPRKGVVRKTFRLADVRKSDTASRSFPSQSTQMESTTSGTKRRSNSAVDRDESISKKPRRSSRCQEVAPSGITKSQIQLVKPQELFKDRILTCIVISPAGRPLRDYRSPKEFLVGMRDAIKAHKALFMDGRILHRDISENNIILTDPEKNNGFSGMLIDLDLAVAVRENGQNEQTEARHMTGTLEFMAIEILKGGLEPKTAGIEHTYRHDLESFFYVFLSICIHCGWEAHPPNRNPLSAWYTGTIQQIYISKRGQMEPGGFEDTILPMFSPTFRCFINLARKLRDLLFSAGVLDVGTREDPEELYGPIIRAFNDAIQALSWKSQQDDNSADDSMHLRTGKRKLNEDSSTNRKRHKSLSKD
ncbi:hypothetical protein GQ44DRAFT_273164 [Phaeosphaeriaceae sp. PMI808]|nr:hypothetical protein GQ44DRAFT_273164 [Phaeosphaeriaceae sp. PMI808]